jgi:aryl-phospho-beta-D-glucosidase BglC (GH1 family)
LRGAIHRWSTSDGLITVSGRPFHIKGVNFHGMESSCRVPHGLWLNPLSYYLDILQDNSFNSLRVPLSYEIMANLDLTVEPSCVTADVQFSGITVRDFLHIFLDEVWARGMSVVFDLHTIAGDITPMPWTEGVTEQHVIDAWSAVAAAFGDHPAVMALELKNEAHGDCDIDALFHHFVHVIRRIESDGTFSGLYFLGAVQHDPETAWGGSFEGSSTVHGGVLIDDALQKRLVLAPHVYGPDVRGEACKDEDAADHERRFGYIEGLTSVWARAPMIVTEFGGFMEIGSADMAYFERFLDYLNTTQSNHPGTYFWTLPETSADTGGILVGPKWRWLDATKLNFLSDLQPNPTRLRP